MKNPGGKNVIVVEGIIQFLWKKKNKVHISFSDAIFLANVRI